MGVYARINGGGGSGGRTSDEMITVNVSANDSSSVNGIIATLHDITEERTEDKTVSGGVATFYIPPVHEYYISFADKNGYITPSDTQHFTAVRDNVRNVNVVYQLWTATITVNVDTSGASVVAPNTVSLKDSSDNLIESWEVNSNSHVFSVHSADTYKVSMSNGTDSTGNIQVSITTHGQNQSVPVAYFATDIPVSYPAGSTCTLWQGTTLIATAPDTTGSVTFTVHAAGTYKAKCENIGTSESAESGNIVVTASGQIIANVVLNYINIYGVQRYITSSSTEWQRTDDAINLTAFASIGNIAGQSDFDNLYPWSAMQRETFDTTDVMVRIPEFYYQRYVDNNIEYIKIADRPCEGFSKHPGSGRYVGAYGISSSNKSVSGAQIHDKRQRNNVRNSIRTKGAGWEMFDLAALSAIQMLYLVEYADNDSGAKIGIGGLSTYTGICDSVPNLTGNPGNGEGGVVYRGIENLWGSAQSFIDGINIKRVGNDDIYFVCTNPENYNDNTENGYTCITGYKLDNRTPANSFIKEMGFDADMPWVILPKDGYGGSSSTYWADAVRPTHSQNVPNNNYAVVYIGLRELNGGIFNINSDVGLSFEESKLKNVTSRIMYVPSQL